MYRNSLRKVKLKSNRFLLTYTCFWRFNKDICNKFYFCRENTHIVYVTEMPAKN